MRKQLKQARRGKGFSQQQMANMLDITLRYYKKIEGGQAAGSISVWDALEDLLGVNQRELRGLEEIHRDTIGNP